MRQTQQEPSRSRPRLSAGGALLHRTALTPVRNRNMGVVPRGLPVAHGAPCAFWRGEERTSDARQAFEAQDRRGPSRRCVVGSPAWQTVNKPPFCQRG